MIESFAGTKTPGRRAIARIYFAALLSLTLSAAQGAPSGAPATQPGGNAIQKPDAEQQLINDRLSKQLPELSFNESPLRDVIEFMSDVSGVNIHVNWEALKSAGVDQYTPVTEHPRRVRAAMTQQQGEGGGRFRIGIDAKLKPAFDALPARVRQELPVRQEEDDPFYDPARN